MRVTIYLYIGVKELLERKKFSSFLRELLVWGNYWCAGINHENTVLLRKYTYGWDKFLPTLIHEVRASPMNPGGHLQVNCPVNPWGIQIALGPQGLGLHGSGLSTHFWFWQMYPVLQSGSTVHSGPQPVMVSGLGTSPAKHRQIGFPSLLAMHIVPGPQGLGSQGSGLKTHLQWSQ